MCELALQIVDEALKVLWYSNEGRHEGGMHAVGCMGGVDMCNQMARLKRGEPIGSATSVTLVDLILAR